MRRRRRRQQQQSVAAAGATRTAAIKPRPKCDAVEEVRRYMQERGPVQSNSRTMYDEILRDAKALEKLMNDDDVVIC